MIFTTLEGSRFLARKCWKKAWMQTNIFCGIFSKIFNFLVGILLYWLRWTHPSFIVSYSVVISILLLYLLPSKELPVRIKINKQESSSKLFSQFSPTPVRSVVLRMFSKRFYVCVILPGSLPSPFAGLQLVTRPSHRKEEY